MTLARAIETGDVTQLPSRRDEDWRWSDLRGLIRAAPAPSPAAEVKGEGPFAKLGSNNHVEVVNGRSRGPLQIGTEEGGSLVLRLRNISDAVGTAHSSDYFAVASPHSTFVLLETYEGAGAGYIANLNMEILVDAGAHMTRIVLTDDVADAISVSTANVRLMPGASYTQTILTTGAKRQRFETHIRHPGQGASVRLDGAYLIGEKRHADLTTVVTHTGEGGATDQLTKGAVAGQGRGVFQGRIVVERGADQTDARMGHHALILDDRAEVDAKPELLIYADDVACSHGNTVGQLDDQAIFYARQRGIPFDQARAMLTEAFVGEVIDRIEHEGAREIARAWAAEKLRGLAG